MTIDLLNKTTSAYSLDEEELIQSALRCLEARLHYGDVLADPLSTKAYLQMQLARECDEICAVLYLDSINRVITFERVFNGTINACTIYPRVIARRALELNAAAIILAHNHPSNSTEPSTADKYITELLVTTMKLFDIRVLDHVIVGGQYCCSFVERGLL